MNPEDARKTIYLLRNYLACFLTSQICVTEQSLSSPEKPNMLIAGITVSQQCLEPWFWNLEVGFRILWNLVKAQIMGPSQVSGSVSQDGT